LNTYGIDIWAENNFFIDDGKVKINHASCPAIIDLVKNIGKDGYKGPLTLRFPHLIHKQLNTLYSKFDASIKEYEYKGKFNAVFPLKVNQYPSFLLPLIQEAKKYNYGLEAGSKAELLIAIAYNNDEAPITVNGFKDKEMIHLGFIAKQMNHDITLTIEGLNELNTIIEVFKETKLPCPNIGLRVKLHSAGSGIWAKSGGIDSKFGLSSTEILDAFDVLEANNMTQYLIMIHFHIGSSMNSISPLKKALKESGNIYAELKNMGAYNLRAINIGGGLAIEYSQFQRTRLYSLDEFTNDVVYILKDIARQKNVEEPDIFTESGRFIAANSTVLITPVLELYSSQLEIKNLRLKDTNPPIIKELYDLYNDMSKKTALEFMHDSLDHMESSLTLFDLGYIDLQDRSNAEVLAQLIIKKAILILEVKDYTELKTIEKRIKEKYLLNFSIFQSLPDYWGIDQEFPVMPLTHLDKTPTRSASLWDITCDSDGEIGFDNNKPLYLHDINLKEEEYFLAFFNVGAYQDIMGIKHNLFSHPTQINVIFEDNEIKLEKILESQNILDILKDIDYDTNEIKEIFKQNLDEQNYKLLEEYLYDNSYLNTIGN